MDSHSELKLQLEVDSQSLQHQLEGTSGAHSQKSFRTQDYDKLFVWANRRTYQLAGLQGSASEVRSTYSRGLTA
jgi:hypothetical protein